MSATSGNERQSTARKRASKACKRCRDQKIKCNGSNPCQQCEKRGLLCHFEADSQKILVSKRYISDLHERLSSFENRGSQSISPDTGSSQIKTPGFHEGFRTPEDSHADQSLASVEGGSSITVSRTATESRYVGSSSEAPLTNPLAFHTTDWVPGPHGNPVFMGTSSNWSFGRRVLTMTYEALMGAPLPPDNLYFDGNVYDLRWDGTRTSNPQDTFDQSSLPTQDFAIYLINSVKFRCGRLFYLFEEEDFMKQFSLFHENPAEYAKAAPLWYVHYLVLLAFGKAFVLQTTQTQKLPGMEFFVQAMKLMPDYTFFDYNPIEKIQVLCCIALYLHCVSCRPAAHRMISQAISVAVEWGMHTEMQSPYLSETYVEKCRAVWWTVYILERQMSSLMGVPMMMAEESISTPLPNLTGQGHNINTLQMQVKLSQLQAKIHITVYGIEGQVDSRYLGATKAVLTSAAQVAIQLNSLFDIHSDEKAPGISRISAYLHLQYHQCIVLITRPLLYIFLQSRLGQSEATLMHWLQSESVKGLLQICLESSRQIIRILSRLQAQGLLENFLPFDLDATFTSTIALIMAAAIDPSLLSDQPMWCHRAYAILEEMGSRGNVIATMIGSELKQLEGLLSKLLVRHELPASDPEYHSDDVTHSLVEPGTTKYPGYGHSVTPSFPESFDLDCELSADQLMDLANSLDIDSLAWPLPTPEVLGNHSI